MDKDEVEGVELLAGAVLPISLKRGSKRVAALPRTAASEPAVRDGRGGVPGGDDISAPIVVATSRNSVNRQTDVDNQL